MQQTTRVSDLTSEDVADYLRLCEATADDLNTLQNFLTAAISYVANYTGLSEEKMNENPDFVIAALVLCQDMWDNRALYVDVKNGGAVNRTVEAILNMHARNLL